MKIEVMESPHRTVLFWLSCEEAADKNLIVSLKPQFRTWKERKYLPVILESGKGSLEDSLYMLMKHNFEILIKNDAGVVR